MICCVKLATRLLFILACFWGVKVCHTSEMGTQWLLKPAQFSPNVSFTGVNDYLDAEPLYCMTEAMYYDARNQSVKGQLAVGIVIVNRVRSYRWPSNICSVVHEGHYKRGFPIHDRCQFSYWCDGLPEEMEDERAWQTAQGVAYIVLTRNVVIKGMENITHYHHKDINPDWAKDLEYCGTIQDHMFYRLFKNQVMLRR